MFFPLTMIMTSATSAIDLHFSLTHSLSLTLYLSLSLSLSLSISLSLSLSPSLFLSLPLSLTLLPSYLLPRFYLIYIRLTALAARVVDAQMPENVFNLQEQQEMFTFQEDGQSSVDKAVELLNCGIKDDVLIKLVQRHESLFVSIEDQGSLLEDKPEAHLTSSEEVEAEEEYQREIRPNSGVIASNSAHIEKVKPARHTTRHNTTLLYTGLDCTTQIYIELHQKQADFLLFEI